MKVRTSVLALLFASMPCLAQSPRSVPTQLFGVTLGGIYDVGSGEKGDVGDLPVARFAGMNTFLGNGVHYYFRPKTDHKAFPYVEKREKPSDKYFATSFRLYLLPVIPSTVKSEEELAKTSTKWEVATIEWSDDAKTKEAAYYWARDLCETFKVDIDSAPQVSDDLETHSCSCAFSSGPREFTVQNLGVMRIVNLSFTREVFDRKDGAVETILRRIKANAIRPY